MVLLVVLVQNVGVLAVGDGSVDGGEMLALGQLLIETPEDLDNTKSTASDGIREITTGRANSTDDADTALTLGGTKSNGLHQHARRKRPAWHRGRQGNPDQQASLPDDQKFSQEPQPIGRRSPPSWPRFALVTEVFSDSDTSIDRSFTSSDRHVRGVGDQAGTLHDRLFSAIDGNRKLSGKSIALQPSIASFTA